MRKMSRTEKLCAAGILLAAAAIFALLLWARQPAAQTEPVASAATAQSADTLSTPEERLPQNLTIGAAPPTGTFTDASGNSVTLDNLRGQPVVLIFWGSWCRYCKQQLEIAPQIEQAASQNGARVLLIDKLDPEKETRSGALAELEQLAPGLETWFDDDLTVYQAWGLQLIPTTVVLDAQGNVGAYATGVLSEGEFRGLLADTQNGPDAATAQYVAAHLMNGDGGVQCSVQSSAANSASVPGGHDVLSESQGLVMQYAVLCQNRELFDRAWNFAKNRMESGGLAAWYVTESGRKADTNAVLDDLRIWAALDDADALWGGYAQNAQQIADAVYTRCTTGDELVSFCRLKSGEKAKNLSLCYGDLEILQRMAGQDTRFSAVAQNAAAIVEGGLISEDFPLYYAAWDYSAQAYQTDDLNTAEALYTLWNLARVGQLKPQSLAWLKAQVTADTLAARYHIDGTVVDGYDYDSTAVYALALLIGRETGDTGLARIARQRMERQRVRDASDENYGRFGQADAAAFDQCMPLLAYCWPTG